jgi:hypothetical protein
MSDTTASTEIVRPSEIKKMERLSAYSPEILRMQGINKLMGPPDNASLCRITKEQIILEALINSCQTLNMNLTATKCLIDSSRELSPGLDGLGRGEAVKCLVAYAQAGQMYPASPFMQEEKPGILSRLASFFGKGKSSETQR